MTSESGSSVVMDPSPLNFLDSERSDYMYVYIYIYCNDFLYSLCADPTTFYNFQL